MMDVSYDIDPNHLRVHEVNYELRIRGVTAGTADIPQKRKFLRKEIRRDQARPEVRYEVPEFNFQTESIEIKDSIQQISEMADDFDGTNTEVYKRIRSRLNHILGRIKRIPDNIGEEISGFRGDNLIMAASIEEDVEEVMETYRQGQQGPQLQPMDNTPSAGNRSYPLHKWTLKFDGTTNKCSVNSFLEQVEELSFAREISKKELYRSAVELFTGQALVWYRYARTKCNNWDELIALLRKDFLPPRHDKDLKEQIIARKQGENEPIVIYIAAMENLYSRLIKSVPATERLEVIRENLLPDYHMHLALQNITSIDKLTEVCRSLEDANIMKKKNSSQFSRRHVAAMEPDLEFNSRPSTSRQAVRYGNQSGKIDEVRCFQCKQLGHIKRNCKQRKKNPHCYGCGREGIIRPNCEKCSKNTRPGGLQ